MGCNMKSDTIIFIKELKKKVSLWRLLTFASIFFLVILTSNRIFNNSSNKEFIAKVNINGVILNDTFSFDKIKQLKNSNIKGVILNINSNGGDVVESEKLYTFFRELSKEKPVVSIINGMGASGAYLVAMASDYIVAYNTSLVGSIGVLIQTYELTDLAKKMGINLINYKSSSLKGAPNPFEKINPDVDMVISQQINDIYDYFLNIFIERRKIAITEAQEIANGQVYTGRQALEYGLVDKIGGENDVLDYFKDNNIDTDNIQIIDFNIYKKSKFDILNNLINSRLYNTINGVMAIYNN